MKGNQECNNSVQSLKQKLIAILNKADVEVKEAKVEEAEIEIAVLKVSCDFKGWAGNPEPLKYEIYSSEGFPKDNLETGFESLKAEFEKVIEKRQQAFELFEKGLDEIIICKSKEENDVDSDFLFLLAQLNGKALAEYQGVIQYVLKDLFREAQGMNDLISNAFYQNYFKRFPNKGSLLDSYVDYYLKDKKLPPAEVLIELSSQRYEGSESEARIYFEFENMKCLGHLDDIGRKSRVINSRNLRMIRKMMEISKIGAVHLYAETEETVDERVQGDNRVQYCNRITRFVKEDAVKEEDDKGLYIKFFGCMCWSIVYNGKEEITYRRGRYQINQSENKSAYMNEIEHLKEEIQKPMPEKLNPWFEEKWLEELIEILRKQKHGTSVIITDDYNEIERLCEFNYGTLLKGAEDICYKNDKWIEEQILSITAIDGALVMNLDRECIAIGVIVDGQVTRAGNTGRGARYNSITNYVLGKESGIFLGIIVSEDGMISVECNLAKKAKEQAESPVEKGSQK